MNRIDLVNSLIKFRNFQRYLEVSMHAEQECFHHISCRFKQKMNVSSSGPIHSRSNSSFESLVTEKFDLIFIDGLHTEEQVLEDINEAFDCLAPNGVIVLHDCMPPDAWHQREYEEFSDGENWNGTVWKAVLRIFNDSSYKCVLLDMDWGCGMIDTAETQTPAVLQLPDKLEYPLHYEWLMKYKCTIAEYLRSMIDVFYHLACIGNWRDVFYEQISSLATNHFRKIHMSVLGTQDDLLFIQSILQKMQMKLLALIYDEDILKFETPALEAIQEHANTHNGYVLYLHSKGVSNPLDSTKTKWRRLMMKELVENWENCMTQLLNYDLIGVNWRDMPPISHFCGNFWYASTAHLRKLADFKNYYDRPLYKIWDRVNDKRLGCEFWIGSANTPPKVLSLFCRNVDFCNQTFWLNK